METKKCKKCATDIPRAAKVCPNCRSKLTGLRAWQIVLIVIGAFIVIGAIGSSGGKKEEDAKTTSNEIVKENKSEGPTKEPEKEQAKEEKKIEVTAEKLSKDYEENEIKGNQLYKDKNAIITGKIASIGEVFGSTYITLENGEKYSITGVQCYFNDKAEIEKIANMKKGDKVKLSGKIEGKGINVDVKDCKFIQ